MNRIAMQKYLRKLPAMPEILSRALQLGISTLLDQQNRDIIEDPTEYKAVAILYNS